ncbi:MAG: hypothetical protein JWL94_1946 [Microbacteriaceae bacterium]|jgi:hypothetical protein|nr:hypothetical protein [Microbacteriaceae bacterium]
MGLKTSCAAPFLARRRVGVPGRGGGAARLTPVASYFKQRRKHVEIPRLRARSARGGEQTVNRVALAELTPDLASYLGRAAYLQLSIFEVAARAVMTAPDVRGKNALSNVARLSLVKYDGLVRELERSGHDPAATMEPFRREIDTFQLQTRGGDWHEDLVTSYVTAGLLDDFFVRLAEGLAQEQASRIGELLHGDTASDLIGAELRAAIDANPRLASRLAMWGRRLVGDTLLIARSALAVPENTAPDEARLEPVFTELITAHTRRMDALGLTA